MPLTLSGRLVKPTTGDHPNLMDIAIGLSRTPRFAGQTLRWFSVLDHTMFGLYLIEESPSKTFYDQRWWLLHDAHEAMTGDVPTDVKTDDLRKVQAQLDEKIFGAFYPDRIVTPNAVARIHEIDNRCLRAEADVLKERTIGGPPLADDVALLQSKLASPLMGERWYEPTMIPQVALGLPPKMERQEEHPLVRQYVSKMVELM